MDNVTVLWTWTELLTASGGRACGTPVPEGVSGFSIDSRTLDAGDLFVALPGDPGPRFQVASRSDRDGHDFLENAKIAGATAALVSRTALLSGLPGILVDDTLDALWALARYRRERLAAQVVAVTGSNGKTTTKSLLAAALAGWAERGSPNNHLGLPLSLARTPLTTTTAIYEIGTNHSGEIAPLSHLANPHVGIVLNVQPAHIGNFENLDELRREKLSMAEGVVSGGAFVREASLPGARRSDLREFTFGIGVNAMIRLKYISGNIAHFSLPGRSLTARIPGGGEHRALSLAAVIATLLALDRDPEAAADLGDELVPAGRGQSSVVNGIRVVDDSYNANPGSMTASIHSFVQETGIRGFALLGEMLELGDESDGYHRSLAKDVGSLAGFWAVGEGMRVLESETNCMGWQAVADDELIEKVIRGLSSGDSILIKGSNRVFWSRNFATRLMQRLQIDQAS